MGKNAKSPWTFHYCYLAAPIQNGSEIYNETFQSSDIDYIDLYPFKCIYLLDVTFISTIYTSGD